MHYYYDFLSMFRKWIPLNLISHLFAMIRTICGRMVRPPYKLTDPLIIKLWKLDISAISVAITQLSTTTNQFPAQIVDFLLKKYNQISISFGTENVHVTSIQIWFTTILIASTLLQYFEDFCCPKLQKIPGRRTMRCYYKNT